MNTLNLSPLFRTAIGFDRLARMADMAAAADTSYPPYNIEKTSDDSYRLTMAVAGFGPDDIELVVKENTLLITGKVAAEAEKTELLYRGIAGRAFERRFTLAEHMVVDGADMKNGLLQIALKRVVPEASKPRKIAIAGATPTVTAASNDSTVGVQAA